MTWYERIIIIFNYENAIIIIKINELIISYLFLKPGEFRRIITNLTKIFYKNK